MLRKENFFQLLPPRWTFNDVSTLSETFLVPHWQWRTSDTGSLSSVGRN